MILPILPGRCRIGLWITQVVSGPRVAEQRMRERCVTDGVRPPKKWRGSCSNLKKIARSMGSVPDLIRSFRGGVSLEIRSVCSISGRRVSTRMVSAPMPGCSVGNGAIRVGGLTTITPGDPTRGVPGWAGVARSRRRLAQVWHGSPRSVGLGDIVDSAMGFPEPVPAPELFELGRLYTGMPPAAQKVAIRVLRELSEAWPAVDPRSSLPEASRRGRIVAGPVGIKQLGVLNCKGLTLGAQANGWVAIVVDVEGQ